MNLKTGDILFCTGKKLLSKSIQIATRSRMSHTATYISVWGVDCIIDAQKDGVQLRRMDLWQDEYNYSYIILRSPEAIKEADFGKRALEIIGTTPYDFWNLIFRQPKKLITGKWDARKNDNDRMICNGATAYLHGLPNPDQYDPQQLFDVFLDNGFQLINQ